MDDADAAERMRVTLDLIETGYELMRQNLRRRNPDASEAVIDDLMRSWILERPDHHPGRRRPVLDHLQD